MADAIALVKYPIWTAWRFVVDFPLAVRNTYVILSVFARTVVVGSRAVKLLRKEQKTWSDKTRGRYIWTIAKHFWARWVLDHIEARMDVVGAERVDWTQPHVVVSNHQSTLDIFPLIAYIPGGRFVCKKEVLAFPVVGPACRNGAQIIIDRADHAQSMNAIREGMHAWPTCNLIFFAEGTRTLDGHLKPFKKGAFAIAKEMRLPIVPVAITGTYDALPKGSLLRLRKRPRFRVEFGYEIPCTGEVLDLTDRTRDVILEMIEQRGERAAA